MLRNFSGRAGPSARRVFLAVAVVLAGCQTWTEHMDLPSGHYVEHPPQAVPPPDPREEKYIPAPGNPGATLIRPPGLPTALAEPGVLTPVQGFAGPQPDAAASKELEEALQEHAEALAALKVATRALEASQKRLEALAKRGVAAPPPALPVPSGGR